MTYILSRNEKPVTCILCIQVAPTDRRVDGGVYSSPFFVACVCLCFVKKRKTELPNRLADVEMWRCVAELLLYLFVNLGVLS